MKKQLHGLRVAYENWNDEDRFESLLRLLDRYDTGITQVALFSSAVHSPLTIEETARRANIMKERIAALKEKGYTAGINNLATIGHHHEDLEHTIGAPFRTMVGKNGETTRSTFCMNDTVFLSEYVAEIYRIYAGTGAEFLWVDDDIRQGHMPIGEGCFCDECVSIFNKKNGFSYTRETLVNAIAEDGTDSEKISLRKAWLDHNSDAICQVFRVIEKSVHSVNPDIVLGFMTGERFSEGYQFARYADALSDGGKNEIMWRPGGGAYTDNTYDEIVAKTEQCGRQNAYLPPYVTVNLSEIENFPYNIIKKSPKSTAMEAAMNMTVGCTGAAFNILPSETGEPIETVEGHIRAIAKYKPFFEKLQECTSGLVPFGIDSGLRIDSAASRGIFNGAGWQYGNFAREMFSFGLPQCFRSDYSVVTVLTDCEAAVMSDEEIKKILSGGVYLNVSAVNYLTKRGFADEIGFSVGEFIPADGRECYTDDEINRSLCGGIRNGRQAFHPDDCYALNPLDDKVRVLAGLIDYHGNELAPCVMGLYENNLGGRICVAGYYPYTWISDYFKTIQLKRVFAWLSRDTLPAYVDSYLRIRNITLAGKGKRCVTLFNTTNDDESDIRVCVKTEAETVSVIGADGNERKLSAVSCGNGYRCVTVDCIRAYEGVAICTWNREENK